MRHRRVFLTICTLVAGLICAGLFTFWFFRPKSLYEETLLVTSTGQVIVPWSINDDGQIVGLVSRPEDRYGVVLWDQKRGAQNLVCFDDYQSVYPIKINNASQVAGTIKDLDDIYRAFLWDPKSGLQLLDTLGGLMSGVQEINNHGYSAGYSQMSSGLKHAVLWASNTGLIDFGTLGGPESHAGSINDSGQVVGYSQVASGQWHAFFWDPNTGMKDIGPTSLIWPPGHCIHINNNGLVVGRFGSSTDEMLISTWSANNGIKPIPSLEGIDAFPIALNDAGQFLLHVRSRPLMELMSRTENYLWMPDRGFIFLRENIYYRRSARSFLSDINNNGQILEWSEIKQRGLLLNPIVEKPNKGSERNR